MAVQPQEAIKPLSVLELNTRIHDLLAARFQSVVVKGEVSGVTLRGGHVWFTLKDTAAAVGAVIFSSTARRLPFQQGRECSRAPAAFPAWRGDLDRRRHAQGQGPQERPLVGLDAGRSRP